VVLIESATEAAYHKSIRVGMILLPLPPMELLAVNVGYYTVKGTVLLMAHRQICAERVEQNEWCFRRTMIIVNMEYLCQQDQVALSLVSTELASVLETAEMGEENSEYHVADAMPLGDTVQLILRSLSIAQNRKKAMATAIASSPTYTRIVSVLPSQQALARVLRWSYQSQVSSKLASKSQEQQIAAYAETEVLLDVDVDRELRYSVALHRKMDSVSYVSGTVPISLKPDQEEEEEEKVKVPPDICSDPKIVMDDWTDGTEAEEPHETATSFLSSMFPTFSIQLQPYDDDEIDDESDGNSYADSDDEMLLHLDDSDRYNNVGGACLYMQAGKDAKIGTVLTEVTDECCATKDCGYSDKYVPSTCGYGSNSGCLDPWDQERLTEIM